ncbi:MAG: exosome complex RNA-binding protein Rrp4 [Candidatus Woesearchaeota archaeon]
MSDETLNVKERDIVVPGEVVAEGMGFLPSKGLYREGAKIFAARLGMIGIEGKVIKLIPLTGAYVPKLNDKVIGKIIDVLMTGWRIDTRSPYSAVLGLKDATSEFIPRTADLTQYYALGDYILCKVINVTSQKLIDVTMKAPGLRKLKEGRLVEVNPHKVPRVIGKDGSMVLMIKNATGCNIAVGQNGWIWVEGQTPEQEIQAVQAIKKVEEEAHLPGLTERIKAYLEELTGKPVEIPAGVPEPAETHEPPREEYRERRSFGGPRPHARHGPRRFVGPRRTG